MTKETLSQGRAHIRRTWLIAAVIAAIALLGALSISLEGAYASEYEGTVYFNLSEDGLPVMSDVTGDPMMMVPVSLQDVADVDLEKWGLEDYAYHEYGGDGTADPDRPTALKLYLYMHEHYKDDPHNSIEVSGSIFSAYMNKFWGYDENLNYYVNGAYPLYYEGKGATCDAIPLEDGDRVDVMHFTDWSFWFDSKAGFNFFADANSDPEEGIIVDSYEATAGEPLPIQVIRGFGDLMSGGDTTYQAADDLTIHVSGKDSLIDPGDEVAGTLDGGMAELTFDEPGLYYIWAEGGEGDNGTAVQSAAAAMVEVTAPANRKPGFAPGVRATENKSINPSARYTVDLSKVFTDADGDQLTYKVSVDNAAYAACDKDYVYTPSGEGSVTLKFKANDGTVDSDDIYTVNLTVSSDVLMEVEGLKIVDSQCRVWPIYVLADYETTAEYKALGSDDYCYPVYKLTLPSAIDFTIVEDQDVFSVLDPDWGIKRNIYSLNPHTYVFDKEDYESEEEAHDLPVDASKYQGTEISVGDYKDESGYDLRKLGYSASDRMVALEVYGAWTQRMQSVNYAESYHILINYDSSAQPSGSEHSLTKKDQVDATCTADGTKAYWTCSKCGNLYADAGAKRKIDAPETIPAGHDWDTPVYEWSTDHKQATASHVCKREPSHTETEVVDSEYYTGKNPTCLEMGKTVYTAKFDNKAFKTQTTTVEDIPALGHDMTKHDAQAATCTEAGNSEYYSCGRCNKYFSDAAGEHEIAENSWATAIDPSAHTWGDPSYEWAADNSSVTATRVCAHNSAHKETETASASAQEKTPATCSSKGVNTYTATFENEAFSVDPKDVDDIPVDENAHKWNDGEVTTPPSCTSEGVKTFTCEYDKTHTRNEPVDKVPHTIAEVGAKEASCTEDGCNAHYTCEVCSALFADENGENVIAAEDVKIPATGHKWGAWKVTKKATETATGKKTHTCSVCETTEEETIPKANPAAAPTGKANILNTIANSSKKTNDVIWDKSKVRGADAYEINWRAKGAGKWASRTVGNTVRGTTTGLSIKGLYEIRVRPVKKEASTSTCTTTAKYGAWSNTVYRYFHTTEKIGLKSSNRGSFTVSWKKNAQATSYQVMFTTNKNGSGAASNINTVGKDATSFTKKGLKRGTTYYVQVRELKKAGGNTYVGNISCPVAVKVK